MEAVAAAAAAATPPPTLRVSAVHAGGAAAGLVTAGDAISLLNGAPVGSASDAQARLASLARAGGIVALRLRSSMRSRDGVGGRVGHVGDGALHAPPPPPSLTASAAAAASAEGAGPARGRSATPLRGPPSAALVAAQAQLEECVAAQADAEKAAEARSAKAMQAAERAAAAASAAEDAAAVDAELTGAAVNAALLTEAAQVDASLAEEGSVVEAAAAQAASAELDAAEAAATEATLAKERAMEAAVAAAVAAHAVEEASARAYVAATRAAAETGAARERVESLRRAQAEAEEAAGRDAAARGAGDGSALPPRRFDAAALEHVRAAGPPLPSSQLPTAVAAVYASLCAVPEGEIALEARLAAARERRAAAEAQRDRILTEATPLRRFVPTSPSEEMHAQLRVESGRRHQLDAELQLIKMRLEAIAGRVSKLLQPPPRRPAPPPKPYWVRDRDLRAFEPRAPMPLSSVEAVATDLGVTAAALADRLAPPGGAAAAHTTGAEDSRDQPG